MKRLSLVLLAALSVPSVALAQEQAPPPEPTALVIVPRVSVFNASLRGKIEADEGTVPPFVLDGTSLDFHSDLDFDDAEPVFMIEVAAFNRIGDRYVERASISYLDASYEGSATLDSAQDFNGKTFAAGTAVDSEVHYRSWGGDVAVFSSDSLMENSVGSLLVGFRYVDMGFEMEGGGQLSDERLCLFYFGLGFRGEARWGDILSGVLQASGYFSFGGFDDGFDLESEEWGGFIFEGMAGLGGTLGMLHLEAGWKYLSNSSYNHEDSDDKFEDNDFNFELNGPWFSATLRL